LTRLPDAPGGLARQPERPPRLPIEKNSYVRLALRSTDRVEARKLATQPHHLIPRRRRIKGSMRDHRAVMLLGAGPRLPPLEEHDAVRTPRQRLVAPQTHRSLVLGDVYVAPVDPVGGLLHENPRPPVTERPHQISRERRAHAGSRIAGIWIRVVAHDVFARRPLPVIQRLEEAHEVGGHWNVRREAGEDLALALKALEQRVGRETHEVELLARIGPGWGPARRQDLVPGRVPLTPEVRSPRFVEPADRSVAFQQPGAKGSGGHVAPAGGHVAAELVADVPHGERRVPGVALCHRLDEPPRG